MDIILNGERRTVPDGMTALGMLDFLNIQHQRVAIELNGEIVKKDMYGSTAIKEGDSLEIVSFMQGGGSISECGVRSKIHRNNQGVVFP